MDRLFACTDGDSLDDCLARVLPAHPAAVDRFEELLADPRTLVKCTHTALLNALRVAFPDSIPAGSFAADLYYLDHLGPAPSSQAEWVSTLHLVVLSQGDTERADALIESARPLQLLGAKGPFIEEAAPPTPPVPARWGAEASWPAGPASDCHSGSPPRFRRAGADRSAR